MEGLPKAEACGSPCVQLTTCTHLALSPREPTAHRAHQCARTRPQ